MASFLEILKEGYLGPAQRRIDQRNNARKATDILAGLEATTNPADIQALAKQIPGTISDPTLAQDLLTYAAKKGENLRGVNYADTLREMRLNPLRDQNLTEDQTFNLGAMAHARGLPADTAANILKPFSREPEYKVVGNQLVAIPQGGGAPTVAIAAPETMPKPPYQIGSRQKFVKDGKNYEGTFTGLDANNEPKWQNVQEIPPTGGGAAEPGQLKASDLIDNVRAAGSRLQGLLSGENIVDQAMASKRPEAIQQAQGELYRTVKLLKDKYPEIAQQAGYDQLEVQMRFQQDKDMVGQGYILGVLTPQGYEVRDATGQLVGYYQ